MKKYGHLVTFVGQKYFNLWLPVSHLSQTPPPSIYISCRETSKLKEWEKQTPGRSFPPEAQGHSFNQSDHSVIFESQ